MSRTRRTCLAACALTAGIAAAVGPGLAGAASEKVQDVFVRNSAESEAIATRAVGITKVDASGRMITISGHADVSGSTVTIQAPPAGALPVQVTNQPAATTAYQQRFFVGQPDDVHPDLAGRIHSERLLRMPADQRLTITHISGGGSGMHDALASLRLMDWCKPEQPSPVLTLPVQLTPNADGAWPAVMQDLSLEIGPDRCLHVEARRQQPVASNVSYSLTIVGRVTRVD